MLGEVGFALAVVGVVVLVGQSGRWTRLPDAVVLAVVGLVYAALPGPTVRLDPDVVLDLVLPPLLYYAALNSSLLALRNRLRAVISLSVLLVLVTAFAVGGVVAWLVPVVPLAAAVVLGAAVAPPDPVAALAVGRRAQLSGRLSTLIEGEGLLNDATALTVYQLALVVAVGGQFDAGSAAGTFVLAVLGGLGIGSAVALLVRSTRPFLTDAILVNAVSLATPFVAYVLAELCRVSGILAVVVAGLIIGHQNPRLQSSASRIQISAVWRLVNFLLEGVVFLLIGMQLPEVVRGVEQYPPATVLTAVAATLGGVLLVRPAWLMLTQHVPRRLRSRLGGLDDRRTDEKALSGREITALSWAGTRGVITLAAAFAIPETTDTGAAFPARDLLLLSAYVVVLVTLVGQGLTFGPLVRVLGTRADLVDQARLRNYARIAAADAALIRFDELVRDEQLSEQAAASIRNSLLARRRRHLDQAAFLEEDPATPRSADYESALRVRRGVLDAQHDELLKWRDAGRLPDSDLRLLQRELDHEERTLPMPTEGDSRGHA